MASAHALLEGPALVTDGGLETDLIFHHGVDLPDFASFPLVEDHAGRELLTSYFAAYVDIARRAGAGLLLETPTWRANADWGARLGYDADDLDRVNRAAVALVSDLRDGAPDLAKVLVGGMLGPRGDGYVAGEAPDPDEAAAYHRPQVRSFARAGVDVVTAYTLTTAAEAVGVVRAARAEGVAVAVSFTVETDGRLPDGSSLRGAVEAVDAAAPPDWFLLNCAHPTHLARGFEPGTWTDRIAGVRPNASTASHAELDEATELDDGDPAELARSLDALRDRLPALRVVGGCCGTDARHVAALWSVAST